MNMRTILLSFFLSMPLLVTATESADSLLPKLDGLVERVLATKQDYIEIYYATLNLPMPQGPHYLCSPLITAYLYIDGPKKGDCEAILSKWGTEEKFEKPLIAFFKIRALFHMQHQE